MPSFIDLLNAFSPEGVEWDYEMRADESQPGGYQPTYTSRKQVRPGESMDYVSGRADDPNAMIWADNRYMTKEEYRNRNRTPAQKVEAKVDEPIPEMPGMLGGTVLASSQLANYLNRKGNQMYRVGNGRIFGPNPNSPTGVGPVSKSTVQGASWLNKLALENPRLASLLGWGGRIARVGSPVGWGMLAGEGLNYLSSEAPLTPDMYGPSEFDPEAFGP